MIGSLNLLIILAALPLINVVIFAQSYVQSILFRSQNRLIESSKLFKINVNLYPIIVLASYLSLPLQVLYVCKSLGIKKSVALKVGIFEFLTSIFSQAFLIFLLFLFNISESRQIFWQVFRNINQNLSAYLIFCAISCSIFLARSKVALVFRKSHFFNRIHLRAIVQASNAPECSKPPFYTYFQIIPLSLVPNLIDSALFLMIIKSDLKLGKLWLIFICITFAYLFGLFSQIPGGLGVREVSGGLLISHVLFLSLSISIVGLSILRIYKICASLTTSVISYFLLGFTGVQK